MLKHRAFLGNLLLFLQSALAILAGIQSEKKIRKDLSGNSLNYIIKVGLTTTIIFLIIIIVSVNAVTGK
jgi:uncharacterized protein HemY